MLVRLNNYKKGLKALKEHQAEVKSPSVWAQLEEEIKELSSKVKDIECQIKKNLAET
jgi:protein subunit release factor A